MQFCFLREVRVVAICFLAGGAASASHLTQAVPSAQPRVRSVVRADTQSGRLVRTVVVSPVVVQPRVVTAQQSEDRIPESELTIPDLVEKTAKKYDVDPLLVHSVIQVESGYNQYALSPKGAQGLMQLMPGTARRFGVRNSYDVKENIEGGVRYLRFLTDMFPEDTRLAIAAYNAGEGAVWKYNNNIPPYRETEAYVYRVGQKYGRAKKAMDKRKSEAKPQTAAIPSHPVEPQYAHVEQFIDTEGRIHLRSVPVDAAAVSTP